LRYDHVRTRSAVLGGSALRFGAVGLLNTLVGLLVILASRSALGLPEVAANAVGYAVGLMVSFLLNRRWTFRHQGAWGPAAGRFAVVVLLAWLLNILCVLALLDRQVPGEVAHALGVVPYAAATYWGCRAWVFRGSGARRQQV
jgi:putative flippase GtrA